MLFGLLFIACGEVEGTLAPGSEGDAQSSSGGLISSSSGCLADFVNWQVPPEHSYIHGATTITLSPYRISASLITQGQYKSVMGPNSNPSKGEKNDELPVDGVTWNNAVAFCRKLSEQMCLGSDAIKLPTEAQWEYAINVMQRIDEYWEWTNDCYANVFPWTNHDPSGPTNCSANSERVVKGTNLIEYRNPMPPNSSNMCASQGCGYISFRIVKKVF